MPGESRTSVAALNPRLITAVHPDSPAMPAAAAATLAGRAGEMWEEDAAFAMERVRATLATLATLGELFAGDGAMHEMQYTGGREDNAAAANCRKAAWSMRDAAREIAGALAARAR